VTGLGFALAAFAVAILLQAGVALRESAEAPDELRARATSDLLLMFAGSALLYTLLGYPLSGGSVFGSVESVVPQLSDFVPRLAMAIAMPAIICGGGGGRAALVPRLVLSALVVGLVYPGLDRVVWRATFDLQDLMEVAFGAPIHDLGGGGVVHVLAGFSSLGMLAMIASARAEAPPEKSGFGAIAFSLGTWLTCLGVTGFTLLRAGDSPAAMLAAVNSLLAGAAGVAGAWLVRGKIREGMSNGALAGCIAVAAGADVLHPVGALLIGAGGGALAVAAHAWITRRLDVPDATGGAAVHGVAGLWGFVACGVLGQALLGGVGGVAFMPQLVGGVLVAALALGTGIVVYGLMRRWIRIVRRSPRRGDQ